MSRASDLADLLDTLDADAPRAVRHLWLASLLAWVRAGMGDGVDPAGAVAEAMRRVARSVLAAVGGIRAIGSRAEDARFAQAAGRLVRVASVFLSDRRRGIMGPVIP